MSRFLFSLLVGLALALPALRAHAAEIPVASPEDVGISGPRLERLRQVIQRHVEAGRISGGVAAVLRNGKAVPLAPVGQMDLESRRPMPPDAIFRIYSMTKPITSVAVMILVEEGRLRLSDPVSMHVPELAGRKVLRDPAGPLDQLVPAEREITVRDLLTHTSGLSAAFMGTAPINAAYEALTGPLGRRKDLTPAAYIAGLGALPLVYPPGTRWNYGASTDVLGHLVAVVSGKPFDVFLRERIFGPLEMRDTDFWVPADKLDRLTANYRTAEGGKLEVFDAPPQSSYAAKPQFLSGGGGLVSTARDYARFAQMLLDGGELDGRRILSPKTIEYMTIDHLTPGEREAPFLAIAAAGSGFGLGFSVVDDAAKHGRIGSTGSYGWGGAAGTHFWVDPQEKLACIVMVQNMNPGALALPADVETAVYQALTD
jgi:CubicO group peptidase (beta-lactamase class C family)